jgi:integrase
MTTEKKTTALRERMREDLRLRNYSPPTEKTYIAHVGWYAAYFKRSPLELELDHARKLTLEPSDINSKEMYILVRNGKGRRTRKAHLSPALLEQLRAYYRLLVRRRSNMTHARDSDELFKVSGDELRPVVADNPGSCVWE